MTVSDGFSRYSYIYNSTSTDTFIYDVLRELSWCSTPLNSKPKSICSRCIHGCKLNKESCDLFEQC